MPHCRLTFQTLTDPDLGETAMTRPVNRRTALVGMTGLSGLTGLGATLALPARAQSGSVVI